jgi:broad specificity phosphatase PhoE
MELVLVRHALPERIVGAEGDGPADPHLTAHGRMQAARVVGALAAEPVDAVYTSPAMRARDTALPLVEALGIDPVVIAGVDEYASNHPTYIPIEEVKAAGGPEWEALKNGYLGEGVDVSAFKARVVAGFEQIISEHPGGRVVVFCHAGVINVFCGHVAKVEKLFWISPAYASITRISASRDGRRGITSINETAHVRDLLPPH